MAKISDAKLNASFRRFDVLNIDYVESAKDIAIRLSEEGFVDLEEIKDVRLAAVNDRKHLKGDFVISMFLDLVKSGADFNRWKNGKRIHTNKREAEKVYHNHFSKNLSVVEFCRQNAMTRNKYYRILNCDVKHEGSKQELEGYKQSVKSEYEPS